MLFHCEHGKDRTGIIAALILLCARVSKEHIKKVSSAWFPTGAYGRTAVAK
jgi:hypothetical protein